MKFLVRTGTASLLLIAIVCFVSSAELPYNIGRRFSSCFFRSGPKDNGNDETNIVPTSERLKQQDEFDLAQDAIFHAVEKTEKAVAGAVEKEVDLLFRHPGDVQRHEKKTCDDDRHYRY
mmetsp:Transcript_10953/g.15776  ORF Transcript_10953/g.15776 Transcript_10953/m.15776 type:complete len:119 (+) Transcript_10953:183-539(+)